MESDQALHLAYNKRALDIWARYAPTHAGLSGMQWMPMLRGAFRSKPDLLIVGMNPSFAREIQRKSVADLYRWPAETSVLPGTVTELIEREKTAQEAYLRYYGVLHRFKDAVNAASSEYLDVLLMRHTNQAEVAHAYLRESAHHHIARDLLDLFSWTLLQLRPTVVLVANAAASRLICSKLPLTLNADSRTYEWNRMTGTPFFLSGMLGGQRALDEYSRQRLAADIADVLRRGRSV